MASSERTPLIATVQVAPPRHRYPHNVLRRFCTVAIVSTLIASVFLLLLPSAFAPNPPGHHLPVPGHDRQRHKNPVSYKDLQEILLTTPDEEKLSEWSKYYTSGAHLAGRNYSQAVWTQEKWKEFGIEDTTIAAYDTYLNYPIGHRLALYERSKSKGSGKGADSWSVKYEASLQEDVLDDDPTTNAPDSIPTFHGYSASGNVTAGYVYVNYGTYQDFEDLLKANISLEGKIAVAKYGGIFRGLKVKRAQDLGLGGAVIFTDPGDDGEVIDESGDHQYPDGPARNPSSVQRGSVQFLSFGPGDPTTPGYPSKPGVPRVPTNATIPSIPSIPISYSDAIPILKALNGHGPKASDFNKFWTRNLGLGFKGVEYNIGPSPDDLVLNLVNEQEYVTTPLWNVIGIINGTLENEVIVVGNHRDAWIVGGAADPNSGSTVINEVIRGFGRAVELGWKPLRTIVFASWDGEEYGLVGSTEWVEEYLPWLSDANVAYVNIDVGTSGPNFDVSASPLLKKILFEVTERVLSPNQTVKGQTVRDVWDGRVSTLGSGSDYTAFQDFAGIPSIDLGFVRGRSNPVYHYHSNYDSWYWMSTFGDPGFHYHAAAAKILGLFTARLVESPVIPLNVTDYAIALREYLHRATSRLDGESLSETDEEEMRFRVSATDAVATGSRLDLLKIFDRLDRVAAEFQETAVRFDAYAEKLTRAAGKDIPWWKWLSKIRLFFEIRKVNTKLKYLERQFLYPKGLDGRPWFKHVVYAPGLWTGYAGAVFPGLVESLDKKDYSNAERWALIIEDIFVKAKESLE